MSGPSGPPLADEHAVPEDPPGPPRKPVPARDALREIREPREVPDDGFYPGGPQDGAGQETLARLLTYYPFTRFFCSLAHRQYPSSHRPETRVARMRAHHPHFYGLCVAADFVLVLLSAILLLGAAAIAIYKTLWLGT